MTFQADRQRDLINTAISSIDLPDGLSLRVVDFDADLPVIRDLPMDEDYDTMPPHYGMEPQDASDAITLIATMNGRQIGQIRARLRMKGTVFTEIEEFVSGIFVSEAERGKGVGSALGKALVEIAEAWRLTQARHGGTNLEGDLDISGDTEPQSGGEAIIDMMVDQAGELYENAAWLHAS